MKRLSLIIFLYILLLSFACRKPGVVGVEVLPSTDLLKTPFSDTASIQVVTATEDSLRADNLSSALLGSNMDPYFGLSEASVYTQVTLGNTPTLLTNSADQLQIDSLVLSLTYTGSYGDTTTSQTVHVFKMTQDIYYDTAYYNYDNFKYDNTRDYANSFVFTPQPSSSDSVNVGGTNEPAQLRIPLDVTLADTLVALANQYQTNDVWLTYFKGIYIKTDPVSSGGSILYFDLLNAYSQVTLYYHEISSSGSTAMSYSFVLNGERISHQQHTFSPTVKSLLGDFSFSNNDTVAFLQSMSGLKAKIKFPYLKHYTDSGRILLNKAELDITPSFVDTAQYPLPSNLLFTTFDSLGNIKFIPDYFENNFGGALQTNVYKFNITRELQQVLNGTIADSTYSLDILSGGIQANRLIIGTGKSAGSKMKLRLFYTKLK